MTDRQNGKISEAELVRRLGELPGRVEPRNDPWPQILSRIRAGDKGRTSAGATWFRLAAAVVLAFSLGIFLGSAWQVSSPVTSPAAQTVQPSTNDGGFDSTPGLGAAVAGAEREYQAAFREFVKIGRSVPELKPATLDAIERDWREMLDAESALSAALEQYPNNPWLNKRMLELRERQLSMLKQLAGLDRTSRRSQI